MNTMFSARLFLLAATLITTWAVLTIAAGAQPAMQAQGEENGMEQSEVYQFQLNVGTPDARGTAQVKVLVGDTATVAQTLTMDRGLCYAESIFAEDVNNDGYVDLALVCVDRSSNNATVLRSWLFDSVAGTFLPNPADRLVADELRD
ncbi:MAG: hypothetical protein DYG96_15750 [Chlorobi bacterium CHB2]|nr:hypothetical protein [Chlorobi bacterium CHB2]